MAKIRVFICIELPEQIKEKLAEIQDELRPFSRGVRWTKPTGIHLTLKFLGDVDEEKIDEIADAVSNVCNGISSLELNLGDSGAFPNFKRPRVYWIGIEEPTGQLLALQADIEKELEKFGYAKENRKFFPHLTLGRVKFPDRLMDIHQKLDQYSLDRFNFTAHEIIVMKSDLQPSGAVYTPLRRIKLK